MSERKYLIILEDLAANIGAATASKYPKLIAATAPDIKKFVHQGKGLCLDKIQ